MTHPNPAAAGARGSVGGDASSARIATDGGPLCVHDRAAQSRRSARSQVAGISLRRRELGGSSTNSESPVPPTSWRSQRDLPSERARPATSAERDKPADGLPGTAERPTTSDGLFPFTQLTARCTPRVERPAA